MPPERLAGGRYERRGFLGAGAFGEVSLYFDRDLERNVAVKMCRRDGDPADLRAEAQRLAKLDHPNIVRVFDVISVEDEGSIAIVMQLARGETLHDVVAQGSAVRQAARWVDQIASALAEAHQNGITHSDLHPGNVVVRPSSAGGDPVVLDFGLSKLIGEALNPHPDDVYHAPESTGAMAPASDFWSLGLIAAELSTATTVATIIGAVDPGERTPELIGSRVRQFVASRADPIMSTLVDRLLDTDPRRRATRDEVAATIRAYTQPTRKRQQGVAVGLASAAVKDHHQEVWRVTERHRVEHRLHSDQSWSDWKDFEFDRPALDIAAVSGWTDHIEVYVLDSTGRVWHRWWWKDGGWDSQFHDLGQPFGDADPKGISAVSAHPGHMDVLVEAADGRIANLWFLDGDDPGWKRCEKDWALQDGWWPFSS